MFRRRTILVLLFVSALFLASCGKQIVQRWGEVAVVYTEIIKKFGEDRVHVNEHHVDGRKNISVTFINSALNDQPWDERFKRAQATAEVVKNTYRSISSVDVISVTFVRQYAMFVVFQYSEVIDGFGFNRDATSLNAPPEHNEESTLTPRASYLAHANQTDIVVGPIQLAGEAGAGVSMIPNFKVAGDANKSQAAPPQTVTLDFASYGQKQRFRDLTKVQIVVDGHLILDKKEQFSTSHTADGQVTEFLFLNIPYKTFRSLVAGEEVRILVGDVECTLDRLEVIALRNMTAYVKS